MERFSNVLPQKKFKFLTIRFCLKILIGRKVKGSHIRLEIKRPGEQQPIFVPSLLLKSIYCFTFAVNNQIMFNATSVTDKIITDKVDIKYINDYFGQSRQFENISLIYVCKSRNLRGWNEQTWNRKGITYHIIPLPYPDILEMNEDAVRNLMLNKALEKVGIRNTNTLS